MVVDSLKQQSSWMQKSQIMKRKLVHAVRRTIEKNVKFDGKLPLDIIQSVTVSC